MDNQENINKIDPPKDNPNGSDPEVYGNYVKGNFGKNRKKQLANLENNNPKEFQRRERMNWLQKEYGMNFDRSLEIVRLYDDIEKQRMENLRRRNRNLFEETREKKIKENNYYDIELIKEIRSIINENKYSHDAIVYRLGNKFI